MCQVVFGLEFQEGVFVRIQCECENNLLDIQQRQEGNLNGKWVI